MQSTIRFAVDGMLGRLAKYLRALGYDTVHRRTPSAEFLREARREGRVFITLRKNIREKHGCKVFDPGEAPVEAQLYRVVHGLNLEPSRDQILTICLGCNEPTLEVSVEEVAAKVPERVREKISDYRICPKCGKIFWWGSHADRMMNVIEKSGVFESAE
ncbi:MAG: hypothetical protein GTO51_08350 [Candidatus Latescibacteria bacterium]|nr:hypothetical protein [Candidatus Latescibacterota bacterium]NIM21963.1 hypothetical protein [Candidatus Latescibacterota bacterium]NIM65981.1 hypothetical protein [Candidatus Latescibacterota bacterium]NIO02389.1 hypothetical protein [Candidatus Latescibacterota bacterium]NIO29299.1 hypothetical protein [Candidatus Latescibacterota bacterium]